MYHTKSLTNAEDVSMQFLRGLFPAVLMKKTTTQNFVTFQEFLADLGSDWGPWRDRWTMYDPKRLTG